MKKNKNFKQHSSIFNYSAKTITIVDFIYILILCPVVEHPWVTIVLIAMFPLLNVPTVKLSEKYNYNYMYYSLTLTLVPLFFLGLLSGSEAPGWLSALSLIMATEMFFLNDVAKRLMHVSIILVVAVSQYLVGTVLFNIVSIATTLSVVTLLTSSIFSFINRRLDEIEKAKIEIDKLHKHTRESIEYASLIQGAVVSQSSDMQPYFKDHFVTWTPKDTVGGDIWLFNELRHADECLIFFIDCTGHGVPGAFVTMIVKAIEREIVANLKKHPEFDISPSIIMSHFNKTMKVLLKQETKDSLSNAGWDGGIIYYNRRTQILKFAGAETALFYIDENGNFKTVKGNRYSVGYKKCDASYNYKESIIEVKEGMKFYCTTDGYLDQNGGEKDFPFGKKRFSNIIKEHHTESMAKINKIFIDEMDKYESMIANNDRNDDMTVIGFEIGKQSESKEDIIKEIVKYEGAMTQNVISAAMDNLELKITDMGIMGTISTITIEYCQNMMNYSKGLRATDTNEIIPAGKIEVQLVNNSQYTIRAINIISEEDKQKIEPKLIEVQGLDKAGIKKRYRELRKSGRNTHEKGGGIGIYEIAKASDSIDYEFSSISEDKYTFMMSSLVNIKS